jgi:glucuronate isomerase
MTYTPLRELSPYRFFSPEMTIRNLAFELYQQVENLPIVSPHGHVDPSIFCDPKTKFTTPVDLLIFPDDDITRMLYSLGIPLETMGISPLDNGTYEKDHRKIWQTFCDNYRYFTVSSPGFCLTYELDKTFDIQENIDHENAQRIYDQIAEKLRSPEYSPQALFRRFNLEVLCTTDAATDNLDGHRQIQSANSGLRILPTFRADGVIQLDDPQWLNQVEQLSAVTGERIADYPAFIRAIEKQRLLFRSMGATAVDCSTLTPYTQELTPLEANSIFQRALKGETTPEDAVRFSGHLLMEMARMSLEDGLVMQLHCGSWRNYDREIFVRFGKDMGCDIPIQTEFCRNLQPLLNKYGKDPHFTLILFTLDESTYSRELAPLAGFYPAVKLGPPWWYLNYPDGMARYFDQVMGIAGWYKTIGFVDDSQGLCSIPARHDIWRRASANWTAGLVARHQISMEAARGLMDELAVGLSRRVYRL